MAMIGKRQRVAAASVMETHFVTHHLSNNSISPDDQSSAASPAPATFLPDKYHQVPVRYIFTALVSIGLAIIYGLKVRRII